MDIFIPSPAFQDAALSASKQRDMSFWYSGLRYELEPDPCNPGKLSIFRARRERLGHCDPKTGACQMHFVVEA